MFNVKIFDTACVSEYIDEKNYIVNYVSVSSVNWSVINDSAPSTTGIYLPLSSSTANIIREKLNDGKDVFILKEWNINGESEVLPFHVTFNNITDLKGYKRRAMSFIKRSINPQMAEVNASIIYGFNVINNRFLEAGIVFSEENRSLKYIEVMEKADDLENEGQSEIAEEFMSLLERYIEYREVLDRSYFAWNLSEEYCRKVEEETEKENVDNVVKEFKTKVDTLNNLK